jgi:predicted PurR-regulated permease PerM
MTPSDESHADGPSGWRRVLLAIGAILGIGVIWGALRPERDAVVEGEFGPVHGQDGAPETEPAASPSATDGAILPAVSADLDGSRATSSLSADPSRPPGWVRPTIAWTVGLVVAVVLALAVLGLLKTVVTYLLLALFFSFAMEPAVNYMHARWHWRPGAATGVLLALVFLTLIVLILVFVPTLLKGASEIAGRLPDAARNLRVWATQNLGVGVSTSSIESGGRQAASALEASSRHPLSAVVGFTASLIGGIFGAFTVGMFTFYMVVEAPQFRRAVLSLFRPQGQQELLSIWEAAIEKTGGYFYSRLLLAGINGGLFYVVLRIVGVPGAAALAFFEGSVAAFIPIVGTYISATVPIVIAFISVGVRGALVLLVYVLIYQQVENYLISPRIQGKTMQLHPAVAFGAALAGGALGGLLWAFLALPVAATVQASASLWVQRHPVVDSQLTTLEPLPPTPDGEVRPEHRMLARAEGILRSTRGWIRKLV